MKDKTDLEKAWSEFIILLGKELKLDKLLDFLSGIITKFNNKSKSAIIKYKNGSEIKTLKIDDVKTVRSKDFGGEN